MNISRTMMVGCALILANCSDLSSNETTYFASHDAENCWLIADRFSAFLILYQLRPNEFTFDFVSAKCDAKKYDLGQPRTFAVAFSPNRRGSELGQIGRTGLLIPNQIDPLPDIRDIVGIYRINGTAELSNSESGQLHIANLEIDQSEKIDVPPEKFLSSYLLYED